MVPWHLKDMYKNNSRWCLESRCIGHGEVALGDVFFFLIVLMSLSAKPIIMFTLAESLLCCFFIAVVLCL